MSDRIFQEVVIETETQDPIDVIAGIGSNDGSDEQPKSSFEIAWDLTHSA